MQQCRIFVRMAMVVRLIMFPAGVMCSGIHPPKYGSMDGSTGCNDARDLPYDSHCVFRCSTSGFTRRGPRFTKCQQNGTWSVDSTNVICIGIIYDTYIIIS